MNPKRLKATYTATKLLRGGWVLGLGFRVCGWSSGPRACWLFHGWGFRDGAWENLRTSGF